MLYLFVRNFVQILSGDLVTDSCMLRKHGHGHRPKVHSAPKPSRQYRKGVAI